MATPANRWKLGLFVVIGFFAAMASLLSFGAYRLHNETVDYQTFFDESVQGLDVGAPVKFRGVVVGAVSDIDIAVDLRHVEVTSSLTVKDLERLHLVDRSATGKLTRLGVPPDLRAQLASAGITGIKFLQIDFFDEKNNPPPTLPFPVADNYIPSAVSTLKNLEDAIVNAVDSFPLIAEKLLVVMNRVESILEDVDKKELPEQAGATLARANQVLASLDATLKQVDAGKLSKGAQETLERTNAAIIKLSALLDKAGGDKGLMVSAQRTADAMGDVARGATTIGPDIGEALRGLGSAANSIERLADAIERDPDMLVKGRAKKGKK